MSDRAQLDALAYADGCLERDRRARFEARLNADPDLRRTVTLWQAQNDALRKAFAAPPRSRIHRTLPRPSNENAAPEKANRPPSGRLYAHPLANEIAERKLRSRRWQSALNGFVGAAQLTLGCVYTPGGPTDIREGLMDAALSAHRAFALMASAPLDILTGDPRRLTRWLGARYQGEAFEPLFASPDWTLRGARIVPGVRGPAAFVLLENERHALAGLLIEPVEASARAAVESRVAGSLVEAARVDGGVGLAVVAPDPALAASLIRPR